MNASCGLCKEDELLLQRAANRLEELGAERDKAMAERAATEKYFSERWQKDQGRIKELEVENARMKADMERTKKQQEEWGKESK